MNSTEHLLAVTHVFLSRENGIALQDVSFEVRPGEHWAIIGPNGSGKSSLMMVLQGFIWPEQGDIHMPDGKFGQVDLTEVRKRIGWVGSDIEGMFNQRESGLDIITSGRAGSIGMLFDRVSQNDRKLVEAIVEEMDLGGFVSNPIGRLSQGQKRLVCIARALMTQPKMLLLDEACAGLDFVARENFLDRLDGIARLPFKPGILCATHHVEEIRSLYTHILMLKEGKVYKKGPVKEILNSQSMSGLFDTDLILTRTSGRCTLLLAADA